MARMTRHWVPCNEPGCGALVLGRDGYCDEHRRPTWQHSERASRNPSPSRSSLSREARGYDRRWRRRRAVQLSRHPSCAVCGSPATEVDHIVSQSEGGSDDYSNLESLCSTHHASKTAREGNRARARLGAQRR